MQELLHLALQALSILAIPSSPDHSSHASNNMHINIVSVSDSSKLILISFVSTAEGTSILSQAYRRQKKSKKIEYYHALVGRNVVFYTISAWRLKASVEFSSSEIFNSNISPAVSCFKIVPFDVNALRIVDNSVGIIRY